MPSYRIFAAILAAVAAYAGLAIYLDRCYVDPRPAGRFVVILPKPFDPAGSSAGTDYFTKYAVTGAPGAVLYEDKMPLWPLGDADKDRGPGRYRFTDNGIAFSPSDLTDPNTSTHRYWLVIP